MHRLEKRGGDASSQCGAASSAVMDLRAWSLRTQDQVNTAVKFITEERPRFVVGECDAWSARVFVVQASLGGRYVRRSQSCMHPRMGGEQGVRVGRTHLASNCDVVMESVMRTKERRHGHLPLEAAVVAGVSR